MQYTPMGNERRMRVQMPEQQALMLGSVAAAQHVSRSTEIPNLEGWNTPQSLHGVRDGLTAVHIPGRVIRPKL